LFALIVQKISLFAYLQILWQEIIKIFAWVTLVTSDSSQISSQKQNYFEAMPKKVLIIQWQKYPHDTLALEPT